MQSVSFRTWTRVAVSISYDDNHYTTAFFIYKPIGYFTLVFTFFKYFADKNIWLDAKILKDQNPK